MITNLEKMFKKPLVQNSQMYQNGRVTVKKDYFNMAISYFVLAHAELIAKQTELKVADIIRSAHDLAANSEETSATAEETNATTQEFSAIMQTLDNDSALNIEKLTSLQKKGVEVNNNLETAKQNMEELEQSLQSIGSINQTVEGIADQTNLLALNAAIEAARVGDAGRGFAVVADEVRKLAAKTKDAVKEVKKVSGEINRITTHTKLINHDIFRTFDDYFNESKNIAGNVQEQTEKIKTVSEATRNINVAMEQLAEASEEISGHAANLSYTTDFGAVIMKEVQELSNIVRPYIHIEPDDSSLINILARRLVDHANYLLDIAAKGGSNIKTKNHHECAFGLWYDNVKTTYQHIPEFMAIDKPHEMVHYAGQKVVEELNIKNLELLIEASAEILKAFLCFAKTIKE
ncbi:MAG: methyl-accepting chemotaxis protein [Dehalobacterium sp.]